MTWITANFPELPETTKRKLTAFTTTRCGGSSRIRSNAKYSSLNLATHVGDYLDVVYSNRALLRETAHLPSEPYWLNQTHSINVVELPYQYRGCSDGNVISIIEADASFTLLPEHVCVVMTADCLPILIVDEQAATVAAIHAGWRGLADGIIEKTILRLGVASKRLHVWLGPAIGATNFEVGQEVKDLFVQKSVTNETSFVAQPQQGKYLCDIYQLASNVLVELGIEHISGGEYCTVADDEQFYSYRRDGQTGRMASLIWLRK